MNKDSKKQNNGLDGIFVPIIEDFTNLVTKGIDSGTKYFIEYAKNGFKPSVVENPYLKLSPKMLYSKKQVLDEDYLGWAVNYDRAFPLKFIDPTKHVFLIGASGWGKTNLLNILMENALKKGQAIIFVDPKGTLEAINDFKKLCLFYKRDFAIFSEFDEEAQSFNPIADMTNTQRVELVMRSFDWGDKKNQFYMDQASMAITEALETLTKGKIDTDVNLHDLYKELKAKHSNENTSGLMAQFDKLLTSDFGKCFTKGFGKDPNPMTLKRAWKNKTCIYIGCSTQGYSSIARTVGKMFVSEAMNLSYWIGKTSIDSHKNMENSIGLFIDEAGSVLFNDFIDLVNKCRSSGINIYTAIQSYSDMEMVGNGDVLMKQLFESYSTWFIQRQTNPENADKLASAFGTYLTQKTTTATDQGGDSGRGSIREAYEYYCHPDILKNINVGQSVLLSHSPKEHAILNVRDFRKSKVYQFKLAPQNFDVINEAKTTNPKKFKGE
jgi:DNA replication protein DnaC